jgi:Domain of unknown function (DUF4157)
LLQIVGADTKKTTARGSSKPRPAPDGRLAPGVPVLGNQAALRLMRKCDCDGRPDCDCDMGDDKKKKEQDSPRTALHRAALSPRTPRVAPPIVQETLRSTGHTLDPETQAFFEARFGRELSHVRIHIDSRASESARAVNALAYTAGRDIVFAPGRFAPRTNEGRRLLAHELAHVVQQPNATGTPERVSDPSEPLERNADRIANRVMGAPAPETLPVQPIGSLGQAQLARQAADPASAPAPPPGAAAPAAAPAPTPETLILQWLDQHQFAPPKQSDAVSPANPSGSAASANPPSAPATPGAPPGAPAAPAAPADVLAEPHVLLNGEEMTVSNAVKLAAADPDLKQPPELIASVIKAQLAKPFAQTAAGLPFIGPGNAVPGINLAGPRDAFGINPAIAKTVEFSTIDDFLNQHGFDVPAVRDPTGSKAILDGKDTTVDDIANLAYATLGQYPSLNKSDVVTYLRQKYVDKRGMAGTQIILGYMLVPKPLQYLGGPTDPKNPLRTQQQFSFTITRQHHASDSPGLETSFQGTVTLSDQGIMNVQAGGQEAIVTPLLNGWIQVSGLLQVMASENWSKSASGTTVISPALQAMGGGQVLVTPQIRSGPFKFLTGNVQLGVQALGGTQFTSSGAVGVANAGLVLNIPFSL